MMESPSSRKRLKTENPVSSMLSKLPNDIGRQILCLTDPTNEEAIKLRLVSKDLRSLVENRPALRLDREWTEKYAGELKYILTTLERYRGNLESFTLSRSGSGFDDGTHNRCIELAIEKGVQNLDLRMMDEYNLPQCIFKIESLVCLNLTDCTLQPDTTRMISWPKLTSLHLECVEMADGVFESMIRGSPLLQVLNIEQCCQDSPSPFHFQVSDLDCLNKLEVTLCDFQTLSLNNVARNLEYLDCRFGELDIGSSEYAGLKILVLNCATTDDKLFFETDFERKFPILEELYLQEHSNLAKIKICSRSLKKLVLVAMGELQEARLELPNIDAFSLRNSSTADTDISIPLLSFEGNSRGWTSGIELADRSTASESWFMELNQFLGALKGSRVWVDVQLGEMWRSVEDDDAVAFSGMIREPYKHTTGTTFTVNSARLITDGALWNCTPDTLTFQNWSQFLSLLLDEMKWIWVEDLDVEMAVSEYEDEDVDQEMAEYEDPGHFNEDHGEPEDEDPDHFNEDYGEVEDEDSDSGEVEDEDPDHHL